MKFSLQTRDKQLQDLESQCWDLVIIGGGATGAACARDASLRGIKTALVEAKDFASGTSSGSSKLLHGGVRYLKNFEFSLVYHAIREREHLQRLYAPFVQKIDFVFPTYKDQSPSKFVLDMGLRLYDSFSFFKEKHKSVSRTECQKRFPYLQSEKLTGAMIYADSFAEDYRLVVEMVKAAQRNGANCLSRLAVCSVEKRGPTFRLELEDTWSQARRQVEAKVVINCAGPFSDEIRKMVGIHSKLHLTQGVHFIVPHSKLPVDKAFVLPDPQNDRILFAIPWRSITYIGTTDTNIERVEDARASHSDLEYVLGIFRRYFNLDLSSSDVIQSWAAVRPLIQPEKNSDNSKISREHQIQENPNNFYHVLGGKLTSHRLMAEEAIDLISHKLNSQRACQTQKIALQDKSWPTDKKELSHLEMSYGFDSEIIRKIDKQRNLDRKPLSSSLPHLISEVIYSIHHEMVLSPIDFIRRRSSLYYEKPDIQIFEAVGKILQEELQLDREDFNREMENSLKELEWDTQGFQQTVNQ